MKKYFYFSMIAACLLNLSSCDFDETPEESTEQNGSKTEETTTIGIKNVFDEGLPKQISLYDDISVDANGRVTKIEHDYETIIFEYLNATRASNEYDVKITVREDTTINTELLCKVNKYGFVYEVMQRYYNKDTYKWALEYDKDNRLIKESRTDAESNTTFEIINITYENGDIVNVTMGDEKRHRDECNFKYTDANHPTPIANKTNIMLFDRIFHIDLDEMEYAYYAGLLGKSTAHLPLAMERVYSPEEIEPYYFNWTLDENNRPIMFTSVDSEDYQFDKITWKW